MASLEGDPGRRSRQAKAIPPAETSGFRRIPKSSGPAAYI
jgi:hypothetical protein